MDTHDYIEGLINRVRCALFCGVDVEQIVRELDGAGSWTMGEIYLAVQAARIIDREVQS